MSSTTILSIQYLRKAKKWEIKYALFPRSQTMSHNWERANPENLRESLYHYKSIGVPPFATYDEAAQFRDKMLNGGLCTTYEYVAEVKKINRLIREVS